MSVIQFSLHSTDILVTLNFCYFCIFLKNNFCLQMTYSSYNMTSLGAFLPITSPHSSPQVATNFPTGNQPSHQPPPPQFGPNGGAPYHATMQPSTTCHPVYYVPYNSNGGSVLPHHPGYNYPVYQTVSSLHHDQSSSHQKDIQVQWNLYSKWNLYH